MPTYTYECKNCGMFDISQKMSDKHLEKCPKCGHSGIRRLITGGYGFSMPGGSFLTGYENPKKSKKSVDKDR